MKVVCINNTKMDGAMETSVNLTIGKVYDVIGNVTYEDSVFPIIIKHFIFVFLKRNASFCCSSFPNWQ